MALRGAGPVAAPAGVGAGHERERAGLREASVPAIRTGPVGALAAGLGAGSRRRGRAVRGSAPAGLRALSAVHGDSGDAQRVCARVCVVCVYAHACV